MPLIFDNVYRVTVNDSRCRVECVGMDPEYFTGAVGCADELPDWMQQRLAVLMVTSHTPPTVEIDGVGRRIDKNTFWLYAPELVSTEINNGNDTGSEG